MPKFPEPPPVATLLRLGPAIHALPAGAEFCRIYFRAGAHPVEWNTFRRFGPVATARFDHHLPPRHLQDRGILDGALHIDSCLAEVFQERQAINRHAGEPWLVGLRGAAGLRLLDLTGAWPTRAGASLAIATGLRSRAQRWSRAIYEAFPDIDGLWYGSSMNANLPALALYERAGASLEPAPVYHRALSDPLLAATLEAAADRFGWPII